MQCQAAPSIIVNLRSILAPVEPSLFFTLFKNLSSSPHHTEHSPSAPVCARYLNYASFLKARTLQLLFINRGLTAEIICILPWDTVPRVQVLPHPLPTSGTIISISMIQLKPCAHITGLLWFLRSINLSIQSLLLSAAHELILMTLWWDVVGRAVWCSVVHLTDTVAIQNASPCLYLHLNRSRFWFFTPDYGDPPENNWFYTTAAAALFASTDGEAARKMKKCFSGREFHREDEM